MKRDLNNKTLKNKPKRKNPSRKKHSSQAKSFKKSSSLSFFHTTKGKVISLIVGLLVLGGIGAGVGISLTFTNSESEAAISKYVNLNKVQEKELEDRLNRLNEDYRSALIDYIAANDSTKTKENLENKSFDELKKEVFNLFDKKLDFKDESFDDLWNTLKLAFLETWRNAFNLLEINQEPLIITVSTSFNQVNNQLLTSQVMELFDLTDKLPKLTKDIPVKYTHQALNHNGELSLTLNLTIGSISINKTIPFIIYGIDLNNAKASINDLIPKEFVIMDSDIPSIDEDTFFTPTLAQEYFENLYNQPNGVTIKFTQNSLTHDGDLVFTFKIIENDSRNTEIVIKKIPIVGIDQGKAKTYLKNLIPRNYTSSNDIPSLNSSGILEGDIVNKFFEFDDSSSYQPPAYVSIAYQVSFVDNDQYTVTFTITKNQQSSTREVTLTIDYFIGNPTIVSAASYLYGLEKKSLTKNGDISSITEKTFNYEEVQKFFNTNDFTPPKDVTITYWHDGLNHDGNLVLNVKIKKDEQNTKTLTFDIPVVGIDQGKAQSYLQILTQKQFQVDDDLSFPKTEVLDATNANRFFTFNQEIPYSNPDNVTITYNMSEVNDYQFSVDFIITRNNPTITSPITITKTYYMGDRDVNSVYDYLENLPLQTLEVDIALPEYLENHKQNFINTGNAQIFESYALSNENVKVKYTHPALSNEGGELEFTLYITKGTTTRKLIKTVTVINIISDTKKLLQSLFPEGRTIVKHVAEIAYHDFKDIDDDLFSLIEQDKPSFAQSVKIQYKIPNTLNKDGDLVIEFKLKKQGTSGYTQIPGYHIRVEGIDVRKARNIISGFTVAENLDLDNIDSLNAINMQKFENDSDFDSNIFIFDNDLSYKNAFKQVDLGEGVEVFYSRPELVTSGNTTFTLTIRKGNVEETLDIVVNVRGVSVLKTIIYFDSLEPWKTFDSTSVPYEDTTITSENIGKYFNLKGEKYNPPQGITIGTNPTSATNGVFKQDFVIREDESGVTKSYYVDYKLKS